jgi:FkbM family methyltransferase
MPPSFGGDIIFVSPDVALRYWKRDLEGSFKDLFDFARKFVTSGACVWDVGGSMGLFAFAAAFRAGKTGLVVAMEPDPYSFALLRRSVDAMSTQNGEVIVLPVAVGQFVGNCDLHIAKRGRSMSHLGCLKGSFATGGVRDTIPVRTVTLDSLLERFRPPKVVKIDVEGGESGVLKGATRLLSEIRPIILCEIFPENANDCTETLRSRGYTLYDFADLGRGPIDRAACDTLALPEAGWQPALEQE